MVPEPKGTVNQSREEKSIINSCAFQKMASGDSASGDSASGSDYDSGEDSELETPTLKKARHDAEWYEFESKYQSSHESFDLVSFTMLLR